VKPPSSGITQVVGGWGCCKYDPTYNPLLIGSFTFSVMQVPPLIKDFTGSIPLYWDVMDDTSKVFGSGVPTTPTSKIFISGILHPSVSNITTIVVSFTIVAMINNTAPLVMRFLSFYECNHAISVNEKHVFISYAVNGHAQHVDWFPADIQSF
jgi:hypothetical protein